MLDLCISPGYIPTKSELTELNPPFLRSILYSLEDARIYADMKRPFIITLNNQCREVGGDWSGWDSTVLALCEMFKNRPQDLVIVAGNEFDIYWDENGSVPPEFGADLATRTARICNNYNIVSAATSVASKVWQTYLQIMSDLCPSDVQYFDCHFYGQRPLGFKPHLSQWFHGELIDVINRAKQITSRNIIASEYGVKIRDAGSPEDVADFLKCADNTFKQTGIKYKAWFAYTDAVGAPHERGDQAFGLLSETNERRPAWNAFVEVNQGMTQPQPPVDYLDKWKQKVGFGLLEMMRADQTEPSTASEWRPFDRLPGTPADIEYCIAVNGTHYYWLLKQNKGYRLRPS